MGPRFACIVHVNEDSGANKDSEVEDYKPKVTYSDCLFYPTISPEPKDIQFTIINDREKVLTFDDLNW